MRRLAMAGCVALAATVVLAAGPAVGQAGKKSAPDGDLNACYGYFGSHPDIEACTRVLTRHGLTAEARSRVYHDRARGYAAKGEHDRAIADLTEAIRLRPAFPDAFRDRSLSYLDKGEHDRSIADLNEAIRLRPAFPDAFLGRGVSYSLKGEHDRAIADFNEAIRLRPGFPEAFQRRGVAYSRKYEHDRAIADFNEAIRLLPTFPDAFLQRGVSYSFKGEHDRAIADLTEAIRLRPAFPEPLIGRGVAYHQKGDHHRALADLDQTIQLDSKSAPAYRWRGETFAALGDAARARADFQRTLELPDAQTRSGMTHALAREGLARLTAAKAAASAPPPPHAVSATPPPAPPTTAAPLRRVALVIGNGRYTVRPLANPVNDATQFARALKEQLRFDEVRVHTDANRVAMARALQEFQGLAAGADVALVYFAGHGSESRRSGNFLIPIDARLAYEADLELEAIPLASVQDRIRSARQLAIVILDACRNNDFPLAIDSTSSQRSTTRGLGRASVQGSMVVLYATAENDVAEDGRGTNSPYTAAWLSHMAKPGLELGRLIREVHADVRESTRQKQRPAMYGDLGRGEIFLHARR